MSESIPSSRDLPDALTTGNQWLCWRAEERDGKMTKIPVDPTAGGFASTTDPDTWGDFETARDWGMNRRLHAWAFACLQEHIEDKAREAGLPIEYIRPEYTSQTCHECGHIKHRNSSPFRCQNGECWVSEYHADTNAVTRLRLAGSQKSQISGHGGQHH